MTRFKVLLLPPYDLLNNVCIAESGRNRICAPAQKCIAHVPKMHFCFWLGYFQKYFFYAAQSEFKSNTINEMDLSVILIGKCNNVGAGATALQRMRSLVRAKKQ